MKNGDKIINAITDAFPGHRIETIFYPVDCSEVVYFDGINIGSINKKFFENDFDNPEIEITVKAPLKQFTDYLDITYDNENLSKTEYFIRNAIGKGVRKWVDESQQNN